MKPPNHGMRVRVTSDIAKVSFTGWPILLHDGRAVAFGFDRQNLTGLGFVSDRLWTRGLVQPIFTTDRVEVLR